MQYLLYKCYSGRWIGISNTLMSLELAALFAGLTERLLILVDNHPPRFVSPPLDQMLHVRLSRVTDLIDLPIAQRGTEVSYIPTAGRRPLASSALYRSVFYYPEDLDIESNDFRDFRQGRTSVFTYGHELRDISVIELTQPTLGLYSSMFYVDSRYRTKLHAILRGFLPKRAFAQLAARVASSLGSFNAVHVRRGDAKLHPGMSTAKRQPAEVIERLDANFDRSKCLVLLTDDRQDPFFRDLLLCYKNCVVLDQYIVEEFRQEFFDLPFCDATSLAFLFQLVAAESDDFVGSMTSTFTSQIQRRRGNLGRAETFKFLWSEIPPFTYDSRGRLQTTSVPLASNGEMIRMFGGPYSWNHYHRAMDPSWWREWSESFVPPSPG